MARPKMSAGGGLAAALYSFRVAKKAGGLWSFYRRMRARNACKTCAVGMGGQRGGMVNETGHFPSVCKKSMQAQAGDMQAPISENFFETTPIRMMERMTSAQLEACGRLAFPLIAEPGDTHYRRISWDEALRRSTAAIKMASPSEFFLYCSGRSSNEGAFLAQLVARAYGTSNIHNCSYYCHQASGVALNKVYGSGTASIVLEDLAKADFAMVVGANPASNHPRLITELMHLRRRGGRVVVINPLQELGLMRFRVPSDWRSMLFGSTISDHYLQPKVGSDIALLKALLKGVIERDGLDHAYLSEATSGWEAVRADVEASDWDRLLRICGVRREQVDAVVDGMLQAKRGIFLWAMGLTHHQHGVDNILALANLAMARGWLGREGCGLLPIRGHSNVQGIGSVGVTPGLKKAFAQKLESLYGVDVPSEPGMDTYASMVAAEQGAVRAALLVGGNLYASNPDAAWASRALRKHRYDRTDFHPTQHRACVGTGKKQLWCCLPWSATKRSSVPPRSRCSTTCVSRTEVCLWLKGRCAPKWRSSHHSRRGILAPGRFDWTELRDHHSLRQSMAKVVPGYAAVGDVPPAVGQDDDREQEFQIEGRTFHRPCFNTPDGRAQCQVDAGPRVG